MMKKQLKKVLVLGSGALKIGQAGEFDYSGSQALKALREEGISSVLINPNVATIQTSEGIADKVYFLPVTPFFVTEIIKKERPDGIMLAWGGQTGLNVGTELYLNGVLKEYGVDVLGTSVEAIMNTEDRDLFVKELNKVDLKVPVSHACENMEEAVAAARNIGYPIMIRSAYALGGLGSGVCKTEEEFKEIAESAFTFAPQVLVEESLKGWKEIEFECIRDANDRCFTVASMENFDPLGIHTGESIVVAPTCSLTDEQVKMLQDIAVKCVRHLNIVGECNIQYAFNAETNDYRIIEINARLSRSSALASKATGYPLAFVAAKIALGYTLDQIGEMGTPNSAYVAPSLDYMICKIPRWDLTKFAGVSRKIGSSMKSVGEIMSIGRSFEEMLQKGLRMIGQGMHGFVGNDHTKFDNLDEELSNPTDLRIFAIAQALEEGYTIERIEELTKIDPWFIERMKNIVDYKHKLSEYNTLEEIPAEVLREAKVLGFSDFQIGRFVLKTQNTNMEKEVLAVRAQRKKLNILPAVKRIPTVASEHPDLTNYLYDTLPSCTRLGMAALLPHTRMEMTPEYQVLVDDMPCENLAQRQAVLQKRVPQSGCIQFDDLKAMKKDDLRAVFTGKQVVYIYHNQIDARGDKPNAEDEVFAACREAVEEIAAMIRRIAGSANTLHFIVTADHGFLYKRHALAESDKIPNTAPKTAFVNRRFIVDADPIAQPGVASLPMATVLNTKTNTLTVSYPTAANVFKVAGGDETRPRRLQPAGDDRACAGRADGERPHGDHYCAADAGEHFEEDHEPDHRARLYAERANQRHCARDDLPRVLCGRR